MKRTQSKKLRRKKRKRWKDGREDHYPLMAFNIGVMEPNIIFLIINKSEELTFMLRRNKKRKAKPRLKLKQYLLLAAPMPLLHLQL